MTNLMSGLILLFFLSGAVSRAPILKDIKVRPFDGRTEVIFQFKGKVKGLDHAPSENPLGIILDFDRVRFEDTLSLIPGMGSLLRVKVEKRRTKERGVRVILELRNPTTYEVYPMGDRVQVLIGETRKEKRDGRDQEAFFFYRNRAKRDPFFPLLTAEMEEDTLLKVGKAILVGILGEREGKVALLQDVSGKGYVLRRGDSVSSGRVITVDDSSITFLLNDFGITRKVLLKLPSGQP